MEKWLAPIALLLTAVSCTLLFLGRSDLLVDRPQPPTVRPFERPSTPPGPEPIVEAEPELPVEPQMPTFVEVPVVRPPKEDSLYWDILSRAEQPAVVKGGRHITAHESVHRINAETRNRHYDGVDLQALYCMNGKAVVFEHPVVPQEEIEKFVPQNLRSYRWELYFVKQKPMWRDDPLYVCDEWVAYVAGAKVALDDRAKGRYTEGRVDAVSGCVDFSIYTMALCMAIKKCDPDWWENNENFRRFVVYMMREAQQTFLSGRNLPEFSWDAQEQLLKTLLTSEEASDIRSFVRDELHGAWLDESNR